MDLTHWCLPLFLGALVSLSVSAARGADPLVFITAFEPGEQGAIHAFRFHTADGTLKPEQKTTGVEYPFFLAVSPDQKYLYSIHAKSFGSPAEEEVAAYAIDAKTGGLKLLNRQSSKGSASCYLAVDATGKSLLVANYTSGSIAALPIQEDGSLGSAASFIQHRGGSVDQSRQKEPHAHCIVLSPNNQFVYVADLGLDQILNYKLDPATAKLTPNHQPFVRTIPTAGPRHLTFHPQLKSMYVINELKNSVTRFEWNESTGDLIERKTVDTLPSDFTGASYCADVKITPNGKFLYGTNRGHDSLAAYEIAENGDLQLIAIEPSLGGGPQNLCIDPSGKWLLCANMPGKNVVVFAIDQATGKLHAHGEPIAISSPSCIMLLP